MKEPIKWHTEKRLVSDLVPYTKNPRIITESGLKQLKESFDEIGFAQPVNINIDNVILSGHARVKQLIQDGVKEVDVYVPNRKLTDKEEEAVIVRMNKNTAGQWDFDILANEFELEDLLDWGFDEFDILREDEVKKEDKEIDLSFDYKLEVDCLTEENQKYLEGELRDREFKVRVLL